MSAPPPSGAQVLLAAGGYEACTTEVGAGLRTLSHRGRDLIDGFAATELCWAAHGQVLLPWPNRVANGRYEHGGRTEQLALTQPAEGHAIHGLVRWLPWRLAEQTTTTAQWDLRLHPQPGYPHTLDLSLVYALRAGRGLTVTIRAANPGDGPAPFGVGFHPYLQAGSAVVDDDILTLPASRVLHTDRQAIPDGLVDVTAVDLDFRHGRRLGRLPLDHAFGDLTPDDDGRTTITLRGDAGATTLWADPAFRWIQLFTGDSLGPEHARRALAVEPMTCPADAFNSGTDLLLLQPRAHFAASWGIVAG